jgi:CubicO group peptidase (beta-lactamase class C family)
MTTSASGSYRLRTGLAFLLLIAGAAAITSRHFAAAQAAPPGKPAPAQADLVPMARAETVGMSSKRLERIHAFIQGFIDRDEIAGAVTLVARHGKVVHFEAQGYRSKEDKAVMEKDTIFSLMSMTKPIVSTALMMLWEEGRFLLDDPIARWLPAYANKQVLENGKLVNANPVTVRHILTHTSGLSLSAAPATVSNENVLATQAQRDAAAQAQRGRPAAPAQPLARPRTVAEAIDRAAPLPLHFQPGTKWEYGSSTDFVAVLVEKMSGMTIDQFIRERIFQPLSIRDTHYNIPKEKVNRVAAVYRPGPDGRITLLRKPEFHEPTTYFPGVAGLNGTAADYFRFCQMLLNGGELDGVRLLGRMTVDNMFSNHIGTGKPVYIRGDGYGFGLGAGVLTDPAKTTDAFSIGTWSWGGADGTIFYIDPQEDLIAILMVQLNPYTRSGIRPKFSNVVSQAITDSLAGQKPKVMGYDTPR